MNSRAWGLFTLIAVLTALIASPFTASAVDNYCPLTLWGQWNGVYYYYSLACPDPPGGYNMVPADRLHTLGTGCTAALNTDPIAFIRVAEKNNPRTNELPIHYSKTSTITQYVSKQKAGARAGVGEDDASTFFASATRCAAANEIYLKVEAKDGTRFFRVLEFTPDKSKFADLSTAAQNALDTFRIGQELSENPGNTMAAQIDTQFATGEPKYDYRQHVLTFDSGKKCHVHSKDRMKP